MTRCELPRRRRGSFQWLIWSRSLLSKRFCKGARGIGGERIPTGRSDRRLPRLGRSRVHHEPQRSPSLDSQTRTRRASRRDCPVLFGKRLESASRRGRLFTGVALRRSTNGDIADSRGRSPLRSRLDRRLEKQRARDFGRGSTGRRRVHFGKHPQAHRYFGDVPGAQRFRRRRLD